MLVKKKKERSTNSRGCMRCETMAIRALAIQILPLFAELVHALGINV